MIAGLIESDGIILRSYKLAEADKIVLCLTEQAGLVRGVARGARRLHSRFGAGLESFTLVSISLYLKEGRDLASIKRIDIISSYFHLAQYHETFSALEYMCGLVAEFAPPHEPNPRLFRMTKACIEALSAAPERPFMHVRYFELWLLKLAGFLPEVSECRSCARVFDRHETAFLGADNAVRCTACARGSGLRLSGEAQSLWRRSLKQNPRAWVASEATSAAKTELGRVSETLIARALERSPRASSPLARDGSGLVTA